MAKTDWGNAPFTIINFDRNHLHIYVKGRDKWALGQLIGAGNRGCTPIENPAPRWSAYVFNLREIGVQIDTVHEPHGGDFSGLHGRYILRSRVLPGHVEVVR
ncbi:winged helix domain-containing protein [Loktanella sp. DJP18]|uniref:winged helix domain-containing protein n=1 Tax=Loktanella sp. DJP18 TaxID=3409788 RepID=UPI003BB6629F